MFVNVNEVLKYGKLHAEDAEIGEEFHDGLCVIVGKGFIDFGVQHTDVKTKCGELREIIKPEEHSGEVPTAVVAEELEMEVPEGACPL